MNNPVHSNAFIDMLEVVLGVDLSGCHKVVITADVNEPLNVQLYIAEWGDAQTVDNIQAFLKQHPLDNSQMYIHDASND